MLRILVQWQLKNQDTGTVTKPSSEEAIKLKQLGKTELGKTIF